MPTKPLGAMIGTVTGSETKSYVDTEGEVVVATAPVMNGTRESMVIVSPGIEINPAEGEIVIMMPIGVDNSYIITVAGRSPVPPNTKPGERRMFSVKGSPESLTVSAEIKLKADGTIEIKNSQGSITVSGGEVIFNQGTESAVRFSDMKTGFDKLRDDLNTFITNIYGLHMHPTAGTGAPSLPTVTGTSSAASIDDSEVPEVLLPS